MISILYFINLYTHSQHIIIFYFTSNGSVLHFVVFPCAFRCSSSPVFILFFFFLLPTLYICLTYFFFPQSISSYTLYIYARQYPLNIYKSQPHILFRPVAKHCGFHDDDNDGHKHMAFYVHHHTFIHIGLYVFYIDVCLRHQDGFICPANKFTTCNE